MTAFGTAFEDLSDEEKDAVRKRPKAVQEEVVTDEKGRRRFHGAFTGGFSAGYFNSVGSKHGWVPQTFKSTRGERAEASTFSVDDFMDDEDRGEFGIAAKKIKTKDSFLSTLAEPGQDMRLAWERSTDTSGTKTTKGDDLTGHLMEILKPINDSIGVQLLKKMGWRAGKGIGTGMSRRALEKQKVYDASSRGKHRDFDEQAVREIEERAPNTQFCPEDTEEFLFTSKDNTHGLGYVPLQESIVLAQDYGTMSTGLKTAKRGKGIRGQAFGVGAFEDDDEDIYTTFDLSQYDFEVGASSSKRVEVERFDSTFVPATKPYGTSRKFYAGPKPPSGYRPIFKPIPVKNAGALAERIAGINSANSVITPFVRARFLGERDGSIMELLSDRDRQFLTDVRKTNELRRLEVTDSDVDKEKSKERRKPMESKKLSEMFEEEPMKNHRFQQYVHYLRRGLRFEQPRDMTTLEWEQELDDFQNALTPELRALLPEVNSRQQPLAKVDYAKPIAEQLSSRFRKEDDRFSADVDVKSSGKDHDKVQAVRMKMFGDMTRIKYQWYPSKELCKRFNVQNPYPGSAIVGVPELQKKGRSTKDSAALMDLCLPSTSDEIRSKRELKREDKSTNEIEILESPQTVLKAASTKEEANDAASAGNMEEDRRAPWELLKALFQEEDSSDEGSSSDDEERRPTNDTIEDVIVAGEVKPIIVEKMITVMDLVEDDDVYGPKIPAAFIPNEKVEPKEAISTISSTILRNTPTENQDEDWIEVDKVIHLPKKREERRPKVKKEKKKKLKHSKHHKQKHSKKKRSRRSSSRSGSSSDDDIKIIR